jgi:hypothetical protein
MHVQEGVASGRFRKKSKKASVSKTSGTMLHSHAVVPLTERAVNVSISEDGAVFAVRLQSG